MQLVASMRSQTDTNQTAVIQLQNPNQRWLLPSYSLKGSSQAEHCLESATQGPQITCPLPGPGAYEVSLFIGDEQYGEFAYIGQVEFNRR